MATTLKIFLVVFLTLNASEVNSARVSRFESSRNPRIQHQSSPNTAFASTSYIKSKFPQNEASPQLFNVGYSVRFDNQQNRPVEQIIPKIQYKRDFKSGEGEIITGTRKENVQIDPPSSAHQIETVKKRKKSTSTSSGNVSVINSKSVTAQANFSPTTQAYLEALENVKDVDYQQSLSELYQKKYTWRNLSPNVKIVRSTEVPTPPEQIEERSMVFDHAKVLAKSQSFGFSDAIRNDEEPSVRTQEIRYDYNSQKVAPSLESYRILPAPKEQPSEILVKSNDDLYTFKESIKQETVTPQMLTNSKPQQQEISANKPRQIKTKFVQIVPANLFQSIEPQKQQNLQSLQNLQGGGLIAASHPHQSVGHQKQHHQIIVQHLKLPLPQTQSEIKKQPKLKQYIKPNRGNIVFRKFITNPEYLLKSRPKVDGRKEFKPPPEIEINL